MGARREAVRAYLAAQVEAVRTADTALRDRTPASVHDARVAVRRVRSLLRIFPRLGGAELEEPLRRWSDALGRVRDAEVLAETLSAAAPERLMAQLAPGLEAERAGALTALLAELDAPSHRRLVESLIALAVTDLDTPLRSRAAVAAADRKARKRLRRADDDPALLHRARKAAKRARYAAEAVGDGDLAARWEAVQDALGEHHDCAVALRRLDDVRGAGKDVAATRRVLEERAATALARCRG